VGLSNAAAICYNQTFVKKQPSVNICPGPNIVNFSKVVSLQTMADHIYGRKNIVTNPKRPHLFIAELHLYIDYLREQITEDNRIGQFEKKRKHYTSFCQHMRNGISYYRELSHHFKTDQAVFIEALNNAEIELDLISYQYAIINNEVQTTALVNA
jgi:hypothetical protein